MIEAVCETLKRQAKSKGLTQKQLALELGVSLPTIKRWFAGNGLSLEEFLRLIQFLELNFEDMAALIPGQVKKVFYYTKEQEEFFAENPQYLAYFDQLLSGKTADDITRKFGISIRSTRRYLKALEQLGLIEVHLGNRTKLLVKGEPVWRKNGVLATKLKSIAVGDFCSSSSSRIKLMLHRYSPDDEAKINSLINELSDAAMTANRRAQITGLGRSFGVIVGIDRFSWKLLETVEEL